MTGLSKRFKGKDACVWLFTTHLSATEERHLWDLTVLGYLPLDTSERSLPLPHPVGRYTYT